MKELTVVVEILDDGSITADAVGFDGDKCIKHLNELLRDLGPQEQLQRKPEADRRKPWTAREQKIEGGRA